MIKGIGVDLVRMDRLKDFMGNTTKMARILSSQEIEVFKTLNSEKRKMEYISGRFCAKEALVKALNNYHIKFNYNEITILNNDDGSPYIILPFTFSDKIFLSISHDTDYVISYVVVESI